MGEIRTLRAADRTAMPWKNGGGVTHEIAVQPAAAGMDDFLWRLSMAEVGQPGPFSAFADVDRVLAVLDGELALSGPAIQAVRLTAASAPFAFAGDTPIHGEPIHGAVLDLNAMARRGKVRIEMERLADADQARTGDAAFLVALGTIDARCGDHAFTLERLDCLQFDEPATVAVSGGAGAMLVRFITI